jgi:hypothetical protein
MTRETKAKYNNSLSIKLQGISGIAEHNITYLWHSDSCVVLRTDETGCIVIEVGNTDRDLCGDRVWWNAEVLCLH